MPELPGGQSGSPADTPTGEGTVRRCLVLANQTLGSDVLLQAIQERAASAPCEFWVVVPATATHELAARSVPMPPMPVMGGVLTVPGPPEEGRQIAHEHLRSAIQRWRAAGVNADGEVGDPDPMCAARDVLSDQRFDEIIVSTLHERLSRWLHQDLPRRLEHRFALPVTHVEAPDTPGR